MLPMLKLKAATRHMIDLRRSSAGRSSCLLASCGPKVDMSHKQLAQIRFPRRAALYLLEREGCKAAIHKCAYHRKEVCFCLEMRALLSVISVRFTNVFRSISYSPLMPVVASVARSRVSLVSFPTVRSTSALCFAFSTN